MDDNEIELLANGKENEELSSILQRFLEKHETAFAFPNLSERNRRVLLWTALFQRLQDKSSSPIHALCLAVIRVLSRDNTELENIMCEKWITVLVERAGLYNYEASNGQEQTVGSMELSEKEVAVESLKCLCNLTYHSETARNLCAQTGIAQGLIARLRTYKEIEFKDDIMLYDMKLLFILTALNNEIKRKVKDELHGMDYLVNCLKELLLEVPSADSQMSEGAVNVLNDNNLEIMCEILKAQFNLIMHSSSEEDESEEATYLKLMPVLTALLNVNSTTENKTMLLRSNIANLLTSVPLKFYQYLSPPLIQGETTKYEYLGRNMEAVQSLVALLQHRLNLLQSIKDQYEHLSPTLTVMIKCARGCREQRKYLRQEVLPPLRDVSRRPEEGSTLRNQLCRLLTTPVTSVRDLVAEFLFVLCKEKVSRMVKYTGFGNAAGHLAQKGLLGGGHGGRGARYSSSEDSDTEEYLEAQPSIDPVVGCTRPQYPNPFEGMSEEQKEYEAMKLVNMFDKMVSQGVVKPARAGADGRPQPVEHVLELRDHPTRPQS